MDSSNQEIQSRLDRIDRTIEALRLSVEDALLELRQNRRARPEATAAPDIAPSMPSSAYAAYDPRPRTPPAPAPPFNYSRREAAIPFPQPASRSSSRSTPRDDPLRAVWAWIASHDPEWWLGILGVGFVVLAVILLYAYGVDHAWITPPIRVLSGAVLGGGLFWGGFYRTTRNNAVAGRSVGLREVLLAGAVAVWYVTAYAAVVWYALIPVSVAKLLFFFVSAFSTWLALEERQELFGVLTLIIGFGATFVLPPPTQSTAGSALYLAGLTALGLLVYLMRGWSNVAWLCFFGFWAAVMQAHFSVLTVTSYGIGSPPLALLMTLGAVSFARAPSLRRQLAATGAERYAGDPNEKEDPRLLWFVTLISPVLAAVFLQTVLPPVPKELWGAGLAAAGVAAFLLFQRAEPIDPDLRHLQLTAAALWSVIGLLLTIRVPECIAVVAMVVILILRLFPKQYAGPMLVAKGTVVIVLLWVMTRELSPDPSVIGSWSWGVSGFVTALAGALLTREMLVGDSRQEGFLIGGLTYFATIILIATVLGPVWSPLVTSGYAVLAATLLVVGRRNDQHAFLKKLGAATIILVVGRVLFVDLSSVETVWRVFLFLVVGAVFLVTAYRMQPSRFRRS